MIFNKSSNGAEEAKALLGFIYKSNEFNNLVTYISIAERDIKRVIGPEVFQLAEDHYKSNNYQTDDAGVQLALLDTLVRLIQLPVLLHAYRRYAPLNDLDHSESGRSITVTDDKKPAFEWMLERDNKSLQDLAYETTDVLIEFLDEQVPIPYVPTLEAPTGVPTANSIENTWRGSTTFAAQKDLFINSAREFDRIFPINESRRLYLVLVPFIREVELRHIRPVIGEAKYDAIRELIKDGDLTVGSEENTIHELSKVPVALLTISIAIKRLSVELLPDSVIQSFTAMDVKQSKTANSADRIGVSALLERDGKREMIPLMQYINSLLPVTETPDEDFDITSPFYMP